MFFYLNYIKNEKNTKFVWDIAHPSAGRGNNNNNTIVGANLDISETLGVKYIVKAFYIKY
jgi:hypothetical protein